MKKNIFTTLLFLTVLFIINNCNAANTDYIIGSGEKINTATITSTGTTKTFKDTYKVDNGYIVEDNQYYQIKLNGQDALCLDHQKPYGFGDFYYAPMTVNNLAVRKIYSYATKGPDENFFAQILLWYLSDQGLLYEDNLVKEHGSINYFNTIRNNIADFTAYYMLVANGSFDQYAKYLDEDYKCLNIDNEKLYKVCVNIKQKPSFYDKTYYLLNELVPNATSVFNANKSQILTKISDIEEGNATSVYLYKPSNAQKQNIISANPNDLNETCVSVLRAYSLKENGNVKSSAEAVKYLKEHFPTQFNEKDGTCGQPNDACYVKIVQPTSYRFPARLANRKAGIGARASYTGTIKKIIGTYYACAGKTCTTEEPKKEDYKTCKLFKEAISDPKNVICTDDGNKITYLKCKPGGGGGGSKTCKELLPSYSGVQTNKNFEEFKKKITDPEKATHLADGTISCEPCKPDVKVPPAICDVQGKVRSNFTLSDAVDEYGNRNETCYHNNISYQIDGKPARASIDENFSESPYCDVYCWESVFVDLPNSPSAMGNIIAGSLFYWGINQPEHIFAELQTRRVCWTKPDYDTFTDVWNTNENAISQAYADYMAEVEYNKQGDSDVTVDNDKCCIGKEVPPEPDTWSDPVNSCGSGDFACACNNGCGCDGNNNAPCSYIDGAWRHKNSGRAGYCDGTEGKTYKLPSKDYTIPGTTIKGTSNSKTSGCTTSKPSADDLKDTKEEEKRKAAVARKVGDRYTLREQLLVCQSKKNINESSMYDYSKASIKFTTDTKTNLGLSRYGVGDANLVGDVKPGTVKVETNSAKDATAKTFNCSGINGEIGNSTDPDNSVSNICQGQTYISVDNYETKGYEWDYSGVYAFYYPDDYLFLSKKITATTTNDVNDQFKPTGYEKEKNLYYIEGYGFPVGFTTTEGYFFAKVEISGLGHKGHFDDILNQTDSKEKYGYNFKDGYSCPYYVYNPLYQHQCHYECDPNTMKCKKTADSPADCCDPQTTTCDKGKLAVVYRLIDMAEGNTKKIFPSIDGDGRNPGSNWASFINLKGTAYKNITTTGVIYDNTPMYTIELTPTNIGKIRKDNTELRKNNKDPYTSYTDAKDKLKITCDEYQDETKSCVSNYITTLMNGNYKVITGGSFKITNESQRLKALRNYKTCYDNSNPNC